MEMLQRWMPLSDVFDRILGVMSLTCESMKRTTSLWDEMHSMKCWNHSANIIALIQPFGDRYTNEHMGFQPIIFFLTPLKITKVGMLIPDAHMQHSKVVVTPLSPEFCL